MLAYQANTLTQIINASFVYRHAQRALTQIIVRPVLLICGFIKQHAMQFAPVLFIIAQTEDVSHVNLHAMNVTRCQAVKIV